MEHPVERHSSISGIEININMSLLNRKLQKIIFNSVRSISKLKKRKILQDESSFEGMLSSNTGLIAGKKDFKGSVLITIGSNKIHWIKHIIFTYSIKEAHQLII